MKTVFFTHCTDDWYEPVGCFKLETTLRRFHPDIPLVRFDSQAISEQFLRLPGLHWDIMIPVFGRLLARDYELVIHLDADSCVTAPLDELLAGDFEIAGVRNNDDFGCLNIRHADMDPVCYLNCGLVASTRPDFWDDWYLQNWMTAHWYPFSEQDVWNSIFYSGRYQARVLDPPEASCYYGTSAIAPLWGRMEVRADRLYLGKKQVKVLHQAGGHSLPKLRFGECSEAVRHWLYGLSNSPCLKDALGRWHGLGHPLLLAEYFRPASHVQQVIDFLGGYLLRRFLEPYGVVVILGGHIGLSSACLSPMARRVIACEPFPPYLPLFEATQAHVGRTNVELCPRAAWTHTGSARLYLRPENTTMHSLIERPALESVPAPTCRLADLFAEYRVEEVDLLLVDVEGGELPLLLDPGFAAVAGRIRKLWVQCHCLADTTYALNLDGVASVLSARLEELGFRVALFEDALYAFRPGASR